WWGRPRGEGHRLQARRLTACGDMSGTGARTGLEEPTGGEVDMSVVIVTGSAGLVGSETARFYCRNGYDVVGIDNDLRRAFFGDEASTVANRQALLREHPRYVHCDHDIRDFEAIDRTF